MFPIDSDGLVNVVLNEIWTDIAISPKFTLKFQFFLRCSERSWISCKLIASHIYSFWSEAFIAAGDFQWILMLVGNYSRTHSVSTQLGFLWCWRNICTVFVTVNFSVHSLSVCPLLCRNKNSRDNLISPWYNSNNLP